MDAEKRKRYENIASELTRLAGGRNNILGIAHCATRLRLVLEDNDKADIHAIEDVDLVNDVCQVLADSLHMDSMSLGDLKTKANKRMNPLQRAVKALSDVFIEIMPGILAAALLTGLSSVLGNIDFVQNNDTLYGLSRLINISSGAIFGFLPLCVAYSTVKRFGGRPIMGIVIGCIMLTNSLADASAAAQGTVEVTTLHIFSIPVDLIGFQGGIIVALLIGIVTAKLDIFFEKKVPEVIRLLVSPLLTTLVSSFLLFMIIGPVGRGLANGITEPALFGVNLRYRYPLIGGCIGGAIGGAVVYFTDLAALGFGTTVVPGIALADPAHNGYVNYIIAHVIALAAGFLFAFILGIGFDRKKTSDAAANTTAGNGKHSAQIPSETAGSQKIAETNASAGAVQTGQDVLPEEIGAFTSGEFIGIEKVKDPTFAQKILGDCVAIVPSEGKIYAPCDASVEMVMDTKHAVGLRTAAGNGILIHVGIDTVNLQGKYFDVHVTDGQSIRKGDLIMDFDKDKIAAEGYDTSACLIFTEPVDGAHIDREPEHTVKAGEKIAVIAK